MTSCREASVSEKRERMSEETQREAVARPGEVSPGAGMPSIVIATCPAGSERMASELPGSMKGASMHGARGRMIFTALGPYEPETGIPILSTAPLSPEKCCGTNGKRVQRHTNLAWFCGRTAMPLARLT
jgi:hypothetical protein